MANEYFGKVSQKGIQIIPVVVTDVALATLASLVGLIIGTGMKAITKNFLVKKIHILLTVTGIATAEPVIIGIAANDSGVSGGMGVGGVSALLDPDASEAYLTQRELVNTVWHETVSMVGFVSSGPLDGSVIDKWVSVGGGKGIPCMAGAGPEIFAFNPTGDALTTGGLVNGVVTFYGVWLED